jgi:hypothetical protein
MRFVVWYLVELFRLFFGFEVFPFSSLFFLQLRSLGQLGPFWQGFGCG